MVNNSVPSNTTPGTAEAGSPGFVAPSGTALVSVSTTADAILATVRSAIAPDLVCPHCQSTRAANGTRNVRVRDVPIKGQPVFIYWKRQQYRCRFGCGRASEEARHPAFDDRRRLTRRFVDWIATEGTKTTFVALAKQSGMNERLVRQIFRTNAAAHAGSPLRATMLAIEQVMLAGKRRPAVIDVQKKKFIDVFSSADELTEELALYELADIPKFEETTVLVLDIGLDFSTSLFPKAQIVVSRSSLIREGTRLMIDACARLFIECAEKEHLSEKFARVLFSKRQDELGYSARRRLARWEWIVPQLYEAYRLKERYIDIWTHGYGDSSAAWDRWKGQIGPQHFFQSVVSLLDSRKDQVIRYYSFLELAFFDTWLAEASKFETHQTHSFSAARVALLNKFQPGHSTAPAGSRP